jgi:hypothetical protein
MSSAPRILLLALALSGWAAADLPKKAPITKYTRLWTDSPFTSKPPPAGPAEVANPLEDYALAGVSPVTGGYRVTLLNKKKPEERIIVESDKPRDGFMILGVTRKPGDPLGTVVRMKSGSVTGTVSFDEKLLTLAAPPPPKPNAQVPPGVQPGQPQLQPGQMPQRQPRPRVVPPPAPQTGQPQPAQLQQGQPVPPPGQPATNAQRPNRRNLR